MIAPRRHNVRTVSNTRIVIRLRQVNCRARDRVHLGPVHSLDVSRREAVSSLLPTSTEVLVGRAFEHGAAYRSEDYKAAALWLPPGVGPDEDALGAVMQEGVATELQGEVFAVLEQVGASHPPVAHWYLPAIGVEPILQGKGYGSALLARGIEVCDGAHVAAYLEATNPANIPLYKRFGFNVVGEIQAGSSPPITPMLRAAR